MNLIEMGLAPGITGHTLTHQGQGGSSYYLYEQLECSCGFKFNGKLTQKNKMDANGQRVWRQHLAAMNIPEEIAGMGSIQKARVRWDVYIFPRSYTGAADFAEKGGRSEWYRNYWINAQKADYNYNYAWAVGISKFSGAKQGAKLIHGIYTSRSAAVDAANKMLRMAEERGDEVTWGKDAKLEAPSITPRLSLVEFVILVDEALESKKLGDVQDTLVKLEEFLNAVPVLQAKRQQLADHHNDLLTMGLSVGIEESKEEGEDPPAADGDQVGSSLDGGDPGLSGSDDDVPDQNERG